MHSGAHLSIVLLLECNRLIIVSFDFSVNAIVKNCNQNLFIECCAVDPHFPSASFTKAMYNLKIEPVIAVAFAVHSHKTRTYYSSTLSLLHTFSPSLCSLFLIYMCV